jgi:hypothetical protein
MTLQSGTKRIPFSDDSVPLPSTPLTQAQYNSTAWHEHDVHKVWRTRWLFAGHAV